MKKRNEETAAGSFRGYRSMPDKDGLNRRLFLKVGAAAGAGYFLGNRFLWAGKSAKSSLALQSSRPQTNLDEALKVPRSKYSLPGLFPGKVVEAHDAQVIDNEKPVPRAVNALFEKGLTVMTGRNFKESFRLFFNRDDVVGIKVNPVGPGMISTRLELIDALIGWLTDGGLRPQNIVIWDRFDYMLRDAGFTPERFPGVGIEGLQTMDEAAAEGKSDDNSRWLKPDGSHVSADNFDKDVYYWVDHEGPKDLAYLNQHVFNGKYSYFGKLLTKKLTKIINVPVFKNSGNAISMATKNIGYGAICNTNRLHQPLSLDVCADVLAFPVIRDKLVLNVTDGLRAQYEGGPMPEPRHAYWLKTLFFATDPIALDMVCHQILVAKRKSTNIRVNEHPRYTNYLRYGQKLGLGAADPDKIRHVRV